MTDKELLDLRTAMVRCLMSMPETADAVDSRYEECLLELSDMILDLCDDEDDDDAWDDDDWDDEDWDDVDDGEDAEDAFEEFCFETWDYSWEKSGEWRSNYGPVRSCHYELSCGLRARDWEKVRSYFGENLEQDFLDAEDLFDILSDDLDSILLPAFEEAVHGTDREIPPTPDRFIFEKIVRDFCRENGFELFDFHEECLIR